MANQKIINLTPHTVTIRSESGDIVKEYPSEGIARASQQATPVASIDGVEVVKMTFGATVDLPSPADGTFYVVSIITANAARAEGRTTEDLLITADPVRDEKGQIIGCKRFAFV